MIGTGINFGQGRHSPYLTRGKKKQTVINILKKIKDKKNVATATVIGLYLLGDYLQDGAIDGSLVVTMAQLHIPIFPFVVFSKAQVSLNLTRWIRPKKKSNGDMDERQTVKLLKRKHRARALTTR